jgi:hypothetical protein
METERSRWRCDEERQATTGAGKGLEAQRRLWRWLGSAAIAGNGLQTLPAQYKTVDWSEQFQSDSGGLAQGSIKFIFILLYNIICIAAEEHSCLRKARIFTGLFPLCLRRRGDPDNVNLLNKPPDYIQVSHSRCWHNSPTQD